MGLKNFLRSPILVLYQFLFELQDNNLGIGTEPERWTPSAGPAGGEDLHLANAAQAVNELAVHAAGHPAPGDELAEMSVAGELKRDACGLGDVRVVRGMDEENTGPVAVDSNLVKDRFQVPTLGCVAVGDADNLETVDFNLFVT